MWLESQMSALPYAPYVGSIPQRVLHIPHSIQGYRVKPGPILHYLLTFQALSFLICKVDY